jgi:hypothetical protein
MKPQNHSPKPAGLTLGGQPLSLGADVPLASRESKTKTDEPDEFNLV